MGNQIEMINITIHRLLFGLIRSAPMGHNVTVQPSFAALEMDNELN